MAINFNLKGLLQDEEFLLGAGLLSAGSQGQSIGLAALPQLINAAKTANAFQNRQRVQDVRDEISKMDMSGMTDLEKAILKLDPIKGYSMIARKNAKPKKSVRQMTDEEKKQLNIPTADRVTATVDENDNITDYKITSASDDRIKAIRKAVTDSKLNEADEALQAVEVEVAKLMQSGEKNLPGIGIAQGNFPDFFTSKKGLKLRSLIQTYENIRLKKRSGSQVTPNELTRSQAELAGSIKTADESVFLDILKENRKVMEKQKMLAFAGFDQQDIKNYQLQGGLQYFDSPLLNLTLGESVDDPFANFTDEELLEKEIAKRNLLKQGFTLDKIEEEINKRNAQKLENSDRGFSNIIDDVEIPESNARSKAVEEYLTSPAFGRLVLEVGGGVLGTAFAPQIGLPLYIGRAAAFVRPALQQVVTRMSGAGIGEAGGALASQSFDPRESVSKEMLRAFVTGATAEGVGTIATKAVGKVLGKNKKLIDGAEEAVETIEQQRKKIISNPKDYDQKVKEATKNGILTPGLLQEGQLVDLLENLSELSLFGGGSVRYAREGAETLASSGITDYVKSLRTVGDLEDLGNLFQKTLSDDLTNFKRASNRKYTKLDNALKKDNPNAVNISAIKTAAKERLKKIGLPGTNPALEKDLIAITKLPDLINFSKANSVRSDFLSRSRNISDQFGNVNKQFATEYGKKFTTAMDEANISESVRIAYDDAQSFYKNGAEVFNTKLFKKIIENDPDVVYKSIVAAGDRPVLVRKTFDILDKRIKDATVRSNLKTALRGEFLDDAIRNSQKSNVQYGQELDATKLDNFFAKKSMMMKELFEPEQLKNIEKLKNALAFSQGKLRKKGGLPGAIFIQMKQSGAVMTLTKLGAIGGGGAIGGVPAAATILLAPGILGKMFTSPKIVKLLTTGFRYNENQTIAGRTFRQIIAQMSKEGLIDEDEKDQALKDIKQGGY